MSNENQKIKVESFYWRGTVKWLRCVLDGGTKDITEDTVLQNAEAFDSVLDSTGNWMNPEGGRVPELYRLMRKDVTVCEFVILRDEAGGLMGMKVTNIMDANCYSKGLFTP